MKKVVFVCTGNTCRSPMAMAFFNALAASGPSKPGFVAISAGLAVTGELLPSENAVRVMHDSWAIDITSHRAHMLTGREVEEACLVLTMTQNHKHAVLSMFPGAIQKVFTLKEYAYGLPENIGSEEASSLSELTDVIDPYGGSVWTYTVCAGEIREAVERVVEKIKKN